MLYFANFAADLQVWKVERNTTDCAVRSSGTADQREFCFLFQSGTKETKETDSGTDRESRF